MCHQGDFNCWAFSPDICNNVDIKIQQKHPLVLQSLQPRLPASLRIGPVDINPILFPTSSLSNLHLLFHSITMQIS